MKKLQNEETKCKKTIITENPCGCRERESCSLVDALAKSELWIKKLIRNKEQIDLQNDVSLFVVFVVEMKAYLIWKNDVSKFSKSWGAYLPYLSQIFIKLCFRQKANVKIRNLL